MSVRRDKRFGTWFYRKWVRTSDGRKVRIFGTPKADGFPETRAGAEEAERRAIARVLETGEAKPVTKEVPTIEEFHKVFLATSAIINKPSSVDSKEKLLRFHIVPRLGKLRLDEVTYAVIEDFKLALAQTPINTGKTYVGVKLDAKSKKTLSGKTINNVLTVLRRMLVVARKRGLIENVPDVEWLKRDQPEFDFLDFNEAERLLAAARGEWRTMILTALRTGMRHGELIGLRWEDVDLVAGRITVRQNVVDGKIGTPKSGKPREIPLGVEVRTALKEHRHLRGPLVFFCSMSGELLGTVDTRLPLWRACKKAGLRQIGWHALRRHSFASHLVMRGASLKAVQELLGHSSIQMTMRYAHLAPEVVNEIVRLLDGPSAEWVPDRVGQSLGRAT